MINFKAAISYLNKQQLPAGGFLSYSSSAMTPFEPQFTYQTNFLNALILCALNEISNVLDPSLISLKSNLARFLLAQKSKFWTWNYWTQLNQEKKDSALPDDLDDSSCAWSALYQFQPQLLPGKALAIITQVLTNLETKPGGPYHTWVTTDTSSPWSGVDLAVNSNIANFLKLFQVSLPSLTEFFDLAVTQQNFSSSYYPAPYPVIYFLSKSYVGNHKKLIIDYLLSQQQADLTWGNSLDTVLAAISLIKLGYYSSILTTTINKYLQRTQLSDGSWPAASFCYDPSIAGKLYYAGAASLTTALVLEYLTISAKIENNLLATNQHRKQPPKNQKIFQQSWQPLLSFPNQLDLNLTDAAQVAINKLQQADLKHEIALWSTYFIQSLTKFDSQKLNCVLEINTANLWGWLAYTIYDDVLDLDVNVALLSLANIAHREFMFCYQDIIHQFPQFLPLLTEIMNSIDLANFREVTARAKVSRLAAVVTTLTLPKTLPDYSQLTLIAEKSIGHALGPIAIMTQLGYTRYDAPIQTWLEFMYHYLTARQLNDDTHDWEQDLQRGNLTPVVVKILQANPNLKASISLNSQTITSLQKIFWHQILPIVIEDIKNQTKLAAQALAQNPIIKQPQFFQQLLDKINRSAEKTLREQQQALEFIQAYEENEP